MAVKGSKGPGNWSERAVAAAKAAEQKVEPVAEPEQQTIPGTESIPVPTVNGLKFLARFVKPAVFEKVESERMVGMDFSTTLTPEHDDLLDANILSAAMFLCRSHAGSVNDIEIPNQTIEIFLAPELPYMLKLVAVEAERVNVDYVTEKRAGKENRVLRLSWRIIAEATERTVEFIRMHFDDQVWIEMSAAQGVLAATA